MSDEYRRFWAEALRKYGGNALKLYRATGLLAPIAGGAPSFGYNEVADIPLKTLDGEDINELFNEFQQVLRIFNSQRTPLIERLTFPVAEPFERVAQVSAADFEEADEFGQPKGIRTPVPYWNMGYDLKYMDLGLRYTFRFLGRADSRQLRANNAAALDADNRLIYKTVFDRAFNNLLTVATMEDTGTAVNCYPFYNGTVQTLPAAPPQWKSFTFTTSHDHYLVSANTAVTSANLDAMWETLYHHGYTEGGTCLLAINLQEIKRIRAFRVASGDSYDWIPARDAYDSTFRGTLVGDLATAPAAAGGIDNFPGFQGVYGPWNVIQEDMIPAGYLFGFVSGGVRAERNPIGFREHENAALRGLKLIPQFERYPLRESFYHHAVGSGIRHRGAGIIMQVKASGSYDIPSVIYGGPGGR